METTIEKEERFDAFKYIIIVSIALYTSRYL